MDGQMKTIPTIPSPLCGRGLTLLHSDWPKLYGVLASLSAIGLTNGSFEGGTQPSDVH